MSDPKPYDDQLLRRLRNEIPTDWLIKRLGWPCKTRAGKFVFLCPICNETESGVNPRTNLARCFKCETNFNPIDFLMRARAFDFPETIEFLKPFLSK